MVGSNHAVTVAAVVVSVTAPVLLELSFKPRPGTASRASPFWFVTPVGGGLPHARHLDHRPWQRRRRRWRCSSPMTRTTAQLGATGAAGVGYIRSRPCLRRGSTGGKVRRSARRSESELRGRRLRRSKANRFARRAQLAQAGDLAIVISQAGRSIGQDDPAGGRQKLRGESGEARRIHHGEHSAVIAAKRPAARQLQ